MRAFHSIYLVYTMQDCCCLSKLHIILQVRAGNSSMGQVPDDLSVRFKMVTMRY